MNRRSERGATWGRRVLDRNPKGKHQRRDGARGTGFLEEGAPCRLTVNEGEEGHLGPGHHGLAALIRPCSLFSVELGQGRAAGTLR